MDYEQQIHSLLTLLLLKITLKWHMWQRIHLFNNLSWLNLKTYNSWVICAFKVLKIIFNNFFAENHRDWFEIPFKFMLLLQTPTSASSNDDRQPTLEEVTWRRRGNIFMFKYIVSRRLHWFNNLDLRYIFIFSKRIHNSKIDR